MPPTLTPIKVRDALTGSDVDNTVVNSKKRQIIVPGDPETEAALAKVTNANPGASDYGSVVRVVLASRTARPPGTVTIGAADAPVVAARAGRAALIIFNRHATQTVWLAFGQAAEADKGIPLEPGGVYEMGERDFTTAEVRGIATGANTLLTFQEWDY